MHPHATRDRDVRIPASLRISRRPHHGVNEAEFVAMRRARDATLAMPQLIWPSVQVNMRAGRMPRAEQNGVCYLKIPVDAL
jgi:hypothetical protein